MARRMMTTLPIDIIDHYKAKHGITKDRRMAEILGVPYSTMGTWRSRGQIPESIHKLVECMLSSSDKESADEILIMRVPSIKAEALKSVLNAMSIRYHSV